jgi:AcrR family transcriptional regulator
VERQVLPFSSLKPLLHRLIGPGTGPSPPPLPSPQTLKVLPFLLRALLTLETSAAQQRDVILELLDFLQVQPCNLCPLFFLAHCLHGWYVSYSRFLLTPDARQDMGGCVASLLRFLQPDFKTAGPNQADDWAVLEGLPTAMAALYAKLSAEGEVEVLSRVVKVLGALPQHQRGRVAAWTEAREAKTNRQPEALVRRCMMGMIEAARGGQAIAGGALPSIRVLLAQYCLAGAVPV